MSKFPRYAENLIANLRGIPEDRSRSKPCAVNNISSLIENALKKFDNPQVHLASIIMKNWRDLVGQKYAHRCAVQKVLGKNQLFIRVENSTIRSELEFSKRAILNKLRSLPGCENFIDIIFTA